MKVILMYLIGFIKLGISVPLSSNLTDSSDKTLQCSVPLEKGHNLDGLVTSDEIDIKSYPFLASYGYYAQPKHETWIHLCTASILSKRTLLTAAHCLRSHNQTQNNRKVLLGQSDLNNEIWSENRQLSHIKEIKIHEKYDGTAAYFDIGIIFTEEDIKFTDEVKPICFSDKPFELEQLISKECGLVGWGNHKDSNDKLSFSHLQVYTQEKCNKKYDIPGESKVAKQSKVMLPNLLTDQTFCAGSTFEDSGSCKGDSGAPLFGYVQGQNHNLRVAYGVVHGCIGACCSIEYPSVFTSLGDSEVLTFVRDFGITMNININTSTEDSNTTIYVIAPIVVGLLVLFVIMMIHLKKSRSSREQPISSNIESPERQPLNPSEMEDDKNNVVDQTTIERQLEEFNSEIEDQNTELMSNPPGYELTSLNSEKDSCLEPKLRNQKTSQSKVNEEIEGVNIRPEEEDIMTDSAMNKPMTEEPKPKIIAVGNPGSGKSTVLNSLAGTVLFKSGVSFGRGLTYQLDEVENKNGYFLDTPGLADEELRKQAGEAISEGLKKGGNYKVIFFVTQEAGRVNQQDAATLRLVLEAAPDVGMQYGIIVNKVSNRILKLFKKEALKFDFLNSLFVGIPEDRRCVYSNIKFFGKLNTLEDEDDVFLSPHEFKDDSNVTLLDFVYNIVPSVQITETNVYEIKTDMFEEMTNKMEFMAKQLLERDEEWKEQRHQLESQRIKENEEHKKLLEELKDQRIKEFEENRKQRDELQKQIKNLLENKEISEKRKKEEITALKNQIIKRQVQEKRQSEVGLASWVKSFFSANSEIIEKEKKNWSKPHDLIYDMGLRNSQLAILKSFGQDLHLCQHSIVTSSHDLLLSCYAHHFVTDGQYIMEFGSRDFKCDGITIHTNCDLKTMDIKIVKDFKMTNCVMERMELLCGAMNYSLALRNSEHAARFIESGHWLSNQMIGSATFKTSLGEMSDITKSLVNVPPNFLATDVEAQKIIYQAT